MGRMRERQRLDPRLSCQRNRAPKTTCLERPGEDFSPRPRLPTTPSSTAYRIAICQAREAAPTWMACTHESLGHSVTQSRFRSRRWTWCRSWVTWISVAGRAALGGRTATPLTEACAMVAIYGRYRSRDVGIAGARGDRSGGSFCAISCRAAAVGLLDRAAALPDRHRGSRERASLGAQARAPRA
jgi:hypothetical protein